MDRQWKISIDLISRDSRVWLVPTVVISGFALELAKQSLWFLCIGLGLLGCTLAASDDDFKASLKLYSDTQYQSRFATIVFKHAGRCYSLDCDSMGDKAASAKWVKLPTSSSDSLVFYSNADCTGLRGTAQLDKAAGVTNFKKLAGQVSSFMVKTKATTSNASTKRSSSNVCDWITRGTERIFEEDGYNFTPAYIS